MMVVHEYIIKRAEKISEIVEGLTDVEVSAVFRTFWENRGSKGSANNE